jgi:hypothetical protein
MTTIEQKTIKCPFCKKYVLLEATTDGSWTFVHTKRKQLLSCVEKDEVKL